MIAMGKVIELKITGQRAQLREAQQRQQLVRLWRGDLRRVDHRRDERVPRIQPHAQPAHGLAVLDRLARVLHGSGKAGL